MASSYGKRTWFHELVGIISLLSMIACFLMLDHKPCQIPLLPREELSRWTTKPITGTEISTKSLREKNQTLIAEQMELFIENYYDSLQIFQIIIGCWSIIIMLFGIINIVPKHEDFKVMTILLMVLIMGFAALFAFYTAFIAFHKPCRALTTTTTTSSTSTTSTTIKHQQEIIPMTRANLRQLRYYYSQQLLQQQNNSNHNQQQQQGLKSMILNTINNNNNNVNNQQQQQQQKNKFLTTILSKFWFNNNNNNNNSNQTNIIQLPSSPDQLIYMLEFRSIKDKRPVNVFEDEDDTMIRITLINSLVGFILLCSDFLFFFDSRQHMIEWRN